MILMLLVSCASDSEEDDVEELGERTVSIISIIQGDMTDELVVQLLVGSCQAQLTPQVDETAEHVRVQVVARGGSPVADCIDSVEIELTDPLAHRDVIDESTDTVVPID